MAVSDYTGSIANPISTLERRGNKADIEKITKLVADYEVEKIIVGIPLGEDGEEGITAKKVHEFVVILSNAVDVPVEMVDERYSTLAADKSLLEGDLSRKKRKKLRDGVAAAWFLQTYLDREKLDRE